MKLESVSRLTSAQVTRSTSSGGGAGLGSVEAGVAGHLLLGVRGQPAEVHAQVRHLRAAGGEVRDLPCKRPVDHQPNGSHRFARRPQWLSAGYSFGSFCLSVTTGSNRSPCSSTRFSTSSESNTADSGSP